MSDDARETRTDDVLMLHSEAPDGAGYNVVRRRAGQLELGSIRPVVEGHALHGELVRLRPREEMPGLFDVDVQYDARAQPTDDVAPEAASNRHGPAQVATAEYRSNWDAIFSARTPSRDVN